MSNQDAAHAWWSRLRHQGLLLSPVVMLERYPDAPEPASFSTTARLRDAHTRFVSTSEARKGDAGIEQSAILAWVDHLLEQYLDHRWGRLAKQHAIPEKLSAVVRIGSRSETLKPHRVVYADANATVPALLVMADTSATIGRGRGRTRYAQFLELLRGTGHRLGLLTNGQQFRLVYAGLDFESWCEWESDRWFDDGEGSEELAGLRQLLSPESLAPAKEGVSGLLDAIEESRKRQADLSSVLRENVRQAVEFLLEDVSAARPHEFRPVPRPDPPRNRPGPLRLSGLRGPLPGDRAGCDAAGRLPVRREPRSCGRRTTRSTTRRTACGRFTSGWRRPSAPRAGSTRCSTRTRPGPGSWPCSG